MYFLAFEADTFVYQELFVLSCSVTILTPASPKNPCEHGSSELIQIRFTGTL